MDNLKLMNRMILLFVSVFLTCFVNAQTPQGIAYQAAAKNASGIPIKNSLIKVRFSILDSIASGNVVYKEVHNVITSEIGVFAVNVGMGLPSVGSFSNINWANNSKFLVIEIDTIASGNNFVSMGIQQIMSVPYSLFSSRSANAFNHYIGELFGGGIVFHLWKDNSGNEHGLIVSLNDLSNSIAWSNFVNFTIGISAQSTWNGMNNSTAIVNQNPSFNSASKICLDFTFNGFDDWYLPSIDELSLLWQNKYNVNRALSSQPSANSLGQSYYWSSTEYSSSSAWLFYFNLGSANFSNKSGLYSTRAIRSF
jgi:hypothetical protein